MNGILNINMENMRLLQHYVSVTAKGLTATEPSLKEFWEEMVPNYALRFPSLTHNVLGMAAAHLNAESASASIDESILIPLRNARSEHYSKAFALYRSTISLLDQPSNAKDESRRLEQEMLMNAILFFMYAISPFGEIPFVNKVRNSRNDLFTTGSGLIHVLGRHYKYLVNSNISDTIKHTPPLDDQVKLLPQGRTSPAKMQVTESLRQFVYTFSGQETRDEDSPDICQLSANDINIYIDTLNQVDMMVDITISRNYHFPSQLWLARYAPLFAEKCRDHRPMAILILLHVVVMRMRLEHNMRITATLISDLKDILPVAWHPFTTWIDQARSSVGASLALRPFYIAMSNLEAIDINNYLRRCGMSINIDHRSCNDDAFPRIINTESVTGSLKDRISYLFQN